MRTTFQEIGLTFTKRFRCSCGKRLTRRKRFSQTLNPFNRSKSGFSKTSKEIICEVRYEGRKWQLTIDPCTHKE
jgi:hypothetical protein